MLSNFQNLNPQTSNIKHRTSNIEHRTPNIGHRTPNIEHRTADSGQRTSDSEHRTFNTDIELNSHPPEADATRCQKKACHFSSGCRNISREVHQAIQFEIRIPKSESRKKSKARRSKAMRRFAPGKTLFRSRDRGHFRCSDFDLLSDFGDSDFGFQVRQLAH